jgi:hypothetical protein
MWEDRRVTQSGFYEQITGREAPEALDNLG